MVLHAHVMLAVVVPLYHNFLLQYSLSIASCALLASKSAWPLVWWLLTPATLQSAAQSIGSQQRAQLYPRTVPEPDDSPPSDNLPRPCQSIVLACSVEGPATVDQPSVRYRRADNHPRAHHV